MTGDEHKRYLGCPGMVNQLNSMMWGFLDLRQDAMFVYGCVGDYSSLSVNDIL